MNKELIRKGEIYWVEKLNEKSYRGSEQFAGRPAVIISNNTCNNYSTTLQVVYLTTQPKKEMETHVLIESSTSNLKEPSTALCEQITTVDQIRLGKYIGRASDAEIEMIDKALMIQLDLDRYITEGPEESHPTMTTIKTKEPEPKKPEYSDKEIEKYKAEAAFYKEQYEAILNKIMSKI